MRDEHGRFVEGTSGNPGGRPRAVRQARDMIEALSPELVGTLMDIVRDWSRPARARVAAATALLDRRYGRPRQAPEFPLGLILPLPEDEERGDEQRGDEEREPPCLPEQPVEPLADDAPDDVPDDVPDADAAPDGGEPAAEPVAAAEAAEPDPAVTSGEAVKEPGRPDETTARPFNEPAASYISVGGPCRTNWSPGPVRPHLPRPCSEAPLPPPAPLRPPGTAATRTRN